MFYIIYFKWPTEDWLVAVALWQHSIVIIYFIVMKSVTFNDDNKSNNLQ